MKARYLERRSSEAERDQVLEGFRELREREVVLTRPAVGGGADEACILAEHEAQRVRRRQLLKEEQWE